MKNKTSLLRLPEIPRPILVLGAVFLLTVGFMFFVEQILRPPCCDANHYLELAKKYNTDGIVATKEPSRTFAYPWILSLIIKASHLINFPESFLVFLAQISAYYLALVVVSNVANEYSRKLSAAIYVTLCANIFVIPYTGITLTDSLYTSIAILLFGGMMKVDSLPKSEQLFSAKWVFFGILLLSLAITIRPAAIWLIAPVFYCLIRLLWKRSVDVFDVLLAVILGAAPLYVQITLNVTNHKVISFLPVMDLGAAQIKWGIENIKYDTWMGGGDARNFYPSTSLINTPSGAFNLGWYFHNPINAIKLLTFKFIGAFDFDYLLPYPYQHPANKWIASFFSFTILWLGIFGVFVHLCTNKLTMLGSRYMPFIISIGWCSVSLISALELRFTLPLISYFIIVSCVVINFVITDKNRKFLLSAMIGWIVFMPLFYQAAKFIRLQSVIQG